MDFLWTPWRFGYVAAASRSAGCIFCQALALADDAQARIVYRGRRNFIILNRFPYTTGHSMIVPFQHIGQLSRCDDATLAEMMELARRLEQALGELYHPDGYNLGMNLGRSAGAGVADHLHLHVLPRWTGDTNFMTTVAETRLEPEDLAETYRKLREALARLG